MGCFSKIENDKVIDLVGVVLSDSETDVRYYYIDRESEFYVIMFLCFRKNIINILQKVIELLLIEMPLIGILMK